MIHRLYWSLSNYLKTLFCILGCSPLDIGLSHPMSESWSIIVLAFWVFFVLIHRNDARNKQVLYLQSIPTNVGCNSMSIPKYISSGTSYHEVWLAFHHFPHVIQVSCDRHCFRPHHQIKSGSPCTWKDHFVSGLWLFTLWMNRLISIHQLTSLRLHQ